MVMTRGFVTIATGRKEYYVLARNLLLSYRFHTKSPLPFAILCDRGNPLTQDFDDVVIIDSPTRSYTDKLRILDLSPYDESIFIDADSLAYADLNGLWDYFRDAPPFGLLGDVFPADTDQAWISLENTGVFQDKLKNLLICQGGIYYVRKDGLTDFKNTVDYILKHYNEFKFKKFVNTLSDETVLTLACAVHGYLPPCPWPEVFGYYPEIKRIFKSDIRDGVLDYVFNWQTDGKQHLENGKYILHFGNKNTRGWLYALEKERLLSAAKNRKISKLRVILAYSVSVLLSFPSLIVPYKIKVAIYNLRHRH